MTPAIEVSSTQFVLAVPMSLGVRSMRDFIANSTRVNYGSTGGTPALDLSLLKQAGLGGGIINYPGGAPVIAALVAGGPPECNV